MRTTTPTKARKDDLFSSVPASLKSINSTRKAREVAAAALYELQLRQERRLQKEPGGLLHFVRYFWDVLEPNREFVDGWVLSAMCEHLEAISNEEITRILINVPPGSMKSLLTNVFWPAWEWSAFGRPGTRYISFSYSSLLTERDNQRFMDLIESRKFQDMWGSKFKLRSKGVTKVSNDQHGWKFASSVRGTGTGERADRVLLDDPHNIKEGESKTIREETVRWFREAMANRLNHMTKSAIIVIMQRVHTDDVSGSILERELAYDHLMIPLLYEEGRHCVTSIGWEDPRTEDGENYWPERMPPSAVEEAKEMGDFAFAAQYQQRPAPRGGGIFREEWWNIWDPEDGKFPTFDFILASCDPSYTDRDENDPCGFVILGVNYAEDGTPRVFLIAAWRKWLLLHGPDTPRELGEPEDAYLIRQKESWGVCEWIAHSCKRFKVDRLLIEAKASGISIAQEMDRLLFDRNFGVELVNPGKSDKSVRANRVQHIFAAGMVYRPDRKWAEMVQDEMAAFPKAKYDDLLDAMTQGLWWLRSRRMLETKAEIKAANVVPSGVPKDHVPLYPV